MAYQSGDIILDDHYNGFRNTVNNVWGTGSGDRGYGQTSVVAAVAAGATITATQWSTLLSRISSAASHQGTALTAITAPTAGSTISAFTALSNNVSAINNNRLNRAAVGADIASTVSGTASWTVQTTHTCTFTFAGGNAARHFFNAGGEIRLNFARSGGTSHTKNSEWTDLLNKAGTIVLRAHGTLKEGGSGTVSTLASSTGYYELTTTNTVLFKQFADSSPYTTNYVQVSARVNAAHADGLGNNGNQIIFTVVFRDDAADNSIPSSVDVVNGTISTTARGRQPSTTVLSNSWGTPAWTTANSQS